MEFELGGNGPDGPLLGVVEAEDVGLEFRWDQEALLS